MLNYNSPIKDNKTYTDLNIKEVGPVMKINLRGSKREFLTVVGKTLNIILPNEPNTSVSSEKLTAMWLSPDEWLVISNNIIEKENNIYELEDLLNNNISKAKLGSVVNVTDHFTMFNLEGKNIYAISKISSETIAKYFSKSYQIPLIICRLGMVYGGGDNNMTRLVPYIMNCLISKQEIDIRSSKNIILDPIYVTDVAKGLIQLLKYFYKQEKVQEVFNLSS